MGKLTETLEKVQKGSGGGMGFGRRRAQSKPRAAGVVVALGQADAGLVEAVAKAGVEGVIFTAQRGKGASKGQLSAEEYRKAAEPLKAASLPWGLDLSEVASTLEPDALKSLREGGADFVSFPLGAPARLLQERPEGLDRIIALGALTDDPLLLLERSVNLLSVQVAQFDFGLTAERVRALTIEDLLRYRMLRETIRFPALYSVQGELGAEEVKTLVKLGASALLVQAEAGVTAAALSKRLIALREELERVPTSDEEGDTPSLAMLPGTSKAESQPKTEDDSIRQH
jgi:hypothetical protein